MKQVVLIGAGGHAKVVVSTCRAAGYEVTALYDDNPAAWGTGLWGIPVVGGLDRLANGHPHPAVIAIGNNNARRAIAERLSHLQWLSIVHPEAYVDPTATLGHGTVVFAGAVIQPDAVIGDHVIVNTAASIDHDCQVGDFAHLAPGVHLAGTVRIGEGAFLGIGAVVIPGRSVGRWTTVGAGAAVVRDLPDGVTAVGVPARPR